MHEIVGRNERLTEISRDYAREPHGTLVVSSDNESRRQLNGLIHRAMQDRGDISQYEDKVRILDSRQEMTGADRQWAGQSVRYNGLQGFLRSLERRRPHMPRDTTQPSISLTTAPCVPTMSV